MEPAADPGTSSPFAEDTYCPKCTYNLRGTVGLRCPECGYDLDAIRRGVAMIPWERRAEIGRWRAYWRTARLFTFQPRRVSECLAGEISYRSARHFRVLTVLIATASAWCATVLAYGLQIVPAAGVVNPSARGFTAFGSTPEPSVLARAFAEVWPVALGDLCILLYLFAVTGAASYFLGPKFLPPRHRRCHPVRRSSARRQRHWHWAAGRCR